MVWLCGHYFVVLLPFCVNLFCNSTLFCCNIYTGTMWQGVEPMQVVLSSVKRKLGDSSSDAMGGRCARGGITAQARHSTTSHGYGVLDFKSHMVTHEHDAASGLCFDYLGRGCWGQSLYALSYIIW